MDFSIIFSAVLFPLFFSAHCRRRRQTLLSDEIETFGKLVSKYAVGRQNNEQRKLCLLIQEVELKTCHGWEMDAGDSNGKKQKNQESRPPHLGSWGMGDGDSNVAEKELGHSHFGMFNMFHPQSDKWEMGTGDSNGKEQESILPHLGIWDMGAGNINGEGKESGHPDLGMWEMGAGDSNSEWKESGDQFGISDRIKQKLEKLEKKKEKKLQKKIQNDYYNEEHGRSGDGELSSWLKSIVEKQNPNKVTF